MKLHALISGLPESLAGGPLLPAVVVGIWLALGLALDQRHRIRHRSTAVVPFVEPDPAERRRNIATAASRISLDLGQKWLPPSPGSGYNKNLVPGREGIVGYVDYDKDLHSPRDIDSRRVSPRGVPQVPLVQEPHENVVLIVIDANQLELAGSPNDEATRLEALEDIALTLLDASQRNNYTVSLLATRDRQPIYLRPGSPPEEIIGAIRRLQPGTGTDQSQSLARMAIDHSWRAKATVVIGQYGDDDQSLAQQLPDGIKKIAVEVVSEWERQLGGLPVPGKINIKCADDKVGRYDTARDGERHRQLAANDLEQSRQRAGSGGAIYCRAHLDQPDIPGQLANALRHEFQS